MAFDKDAAKKASPTSIDGPFTFLGQEVYVRQQSARVRDELDWMTGNGQMVEMRSFFITRCVVDKDGKRIFDDADQDWIGEKPSEETEEVYDLASKILSAAIVLQPTGTVTLG